MSYVKNELAMKSPIVRAALLLCLTSAALAAPLTLTPVGSPIPGAGPVGIAVARTVSGTYAVVGDFQRDTVRTLRLDPKTGDLTAVASVPVAGGPLAVAVSRDGGYAVVSNLRSSTVTSLRLDPVTGGLTPVSSIPSGGFGPSSLGINHEGFVVVANRDSNNLGVLRLDPSTGALFPVASTPVGSDPAVVKVVRNLVAVGHAVSNNLLVLRLDRRGALFPIATTNVRARITAVEIDPLFSLQAGQGAANERGPQRITVGTYPDGDIHTFVAGARRLIPISSYRADGDVASIAGNRGILFVSGAQPGKLTSYDFTSAGLQPPGTLALPGLSSRTLATAEGSSGETYVIVNEYDHNRTLVIRATP